MGGNINQKSLPTTKPQKIDDQASAEKLWINNWNEIVIWCKVSLAVYVGDICSRKDLVREHATLHGSLKSDFITCVTNPNPAVCLLVPALAIFYSHLYSNTESGSKDVFKGLLNR